MNAISNVSMRTIPGTRTDISPFKTITLLCGVGLFVSLLFAAYGLDMSVGFF
jgi:hypothetical protein